MHSILSAKQQQQKMQQNKEPNLMNFIAVEPFNHKTRIFKINEQQCY